MKKTRAFLGLALAVIICIGMLQPFAATPVFNDVPADHWAFSAIEKMASISNNAMAGETKRGRPLSQSVSGDGSGLFPVFILVF